MNSKFEIFIGKDKQYYFRLVTPSGDNIGSSEGYTAKHNAQNGINSVKTNSQDTKNFTVFKGTNNRYYFNLKAPQNKEIILSSTNLYFTKESAELGVEEVMKYTSSAIVLDTTN